MLFHKPKKTYFSVAGFTKKIRSLSIGRFFTTADRNFILWFGIKTTNLLKFTVFDNKISLKDFISSLSLSFKSSWFGEKKIVDTCNIIIDCFN